MRARGSRQGGRMLHRLDPTIPLLWRDPTTVQFGSDPVVAVIPDVTPEVERLIATLAAGVSDSGYRMLARTFGVTDAQAGELLDAVGGCLTGPMVAPAAARATVLGNSELARGIARLLDELGLRAQDAERPDLVVLAGDRVISPADHRGWLQRDIPHLAVVASESSVTVGHVVEPGITACLHCLDLHRRDDDPAWPAIAAQLASLPAPSTQPMLVASAAVEAARSVARRLTSGPLASATARRLSGDGDQLTEWVVRPHPECRCATPPESDWAHGDATAAPGPTTTKTASGGRA